VSTGVFLIFGIALEMLSKFFINVWKLDIENSKESLFISYFEAYLINYYIYENAIILHTIQVSNLGDQQQEKEDTQGKETFEDESLL